MQRATFSSFLGAACFAYNALILRDVAVARFFRINQTWFVVWSADK